jgi:hypothetical protein
MKISKHMFMIFAIGISILVGALQSWIPSQAQPAGLEKKVEQKPPVAPKAPVTAKNPTQEAPSGLTIATFGSWYETFRKGFQEYFAPAYKKFYDNNPFRLQATTVDKGTKLSRLEQSFLFEREQPKADGGPAITQQGLDRFFAHENIKPAKKLRIAFCGTGGGYRAMVLTSGYLAGLEAMGVLNATSYISSLSGSTWFLAPWIMSKDSVREYQEKMREKIRNKTFDLKEPLASRINFSYSTFVDQALWPKFLFDQPLGFIDLYGGLLSAVLFFEMGADQRQSQHLSQQRDWIGKGEKPLPIYTSVSMHKTEKEAFYNWYEFNPFEVRNLDLNLSIPAYAFGSKFNGGKSVEIAPEQSLGFLLGVFGSAIAINIDDLLRVMSYRTEEEKRSMNAFQKAQYMMSQKLIDVIKSNISAFLYTRIFSAQVKNPFLGMTGIPQWLQQKEEITLVDGGIDYNIPVRPLMRSERNVDVIIIGESSGDAATFREVQKMLANVNKVYKYNYQQVDDGKNPTLRLYKDLINSKAPHIVYVNYVQDPRLLGQASQEPALAALIKENNLNSFDPQKCLQDWCGTFNFNYTVEAFNQLSSLAELNMRANRSVIANWLADEFFPAEFEPEEVPLELGF